MSTRTMLSICSLLLTIPLAAQTFAYNNYSNSSIWSGTSSGKKKTKKIKHEAAVLPQPMPDNILTHLNVRDYIAAKLCYPAVAEEKKVEGVVVAKVLIGPDGTVTQAEIVKHLGHGCDEAVLQLLQDMPRWVPYIRNGKAVTQEVQIPVRFYLR